VQRTSTAAPPSGAGPATIDALAHTVDGCYRDALVTVRPATPRRRPSLRVATDHFDLAAAGGRVLLDHRLPHDTVDAGLAGLLHAELFAPGWLRGSDLFERLFTGVVRTSATDALTAWERFYRRTLEHLEHLEDGGPSGPRGRGSIDDWRPVHQHALDLLRPGSMLDLGCGFGFLALRAARAGHPTTASDVSPGTTRLLAAVAPRLEVSLTTVTADAERQPGGDRSVDTVVALQVLQHLDATRGGRVLASALRLARRRVVVAVPLEPEAEETYGHVRTVTLADLHRWGASAGCRYDVHEHHAGWLVLDR
jgi:SAM-dependent methyltransferase